MMMGGMLLIQLVYCAGVGFYALIDSIRSTNSGAEKPPQLVFNLATVAGGLLSYVGFVIFYSLLAVLGIKLFGNWPQQVPTTIDRAEGPSWARAVYVYMAILTFFMPITIIGLATGQGIAGAQPHADGPVDRQAPSRTISSCTASCWSMRA